jgi:hypothetical protein
MSFGMWRRVALVITDVSEERIASIIRVAQQSLVTANFFPRSLILSILMMEAVCSSE